MSQNISKYLPKREEKVNVQARVKKSLHDDVERLLQEHNISWVSFLEASMTAFIDEKKGKKS